MSRVLRALAALVIIPSVLLASALPAAARTDTRDKRVVYIHGYDPFGSESVDCNMWSSMISTMQGLGHTGPQSTVAYYAGDYNCNYDSSHHGSHGTHDGHTGGHDRYVTIDHLGYHVAWMIYDHFTSQGETVDVVAHSMGGLITRYALARVQQGHADFPPALDIEDVITLGTPHSGTGWANWCWTTQCADMRPGSGFINWLSANAPNPQGSGGTDWTAIGSYDDGIVSETSATSMSANHKVRYLGTANIGHSDYYTDTSAVWDSDVEYNDYGGPWYSWYSAPHAVSWSDLSAYLGSW